MRFYKLEATLQGKPVALQSPDWADMCARYAARPPKSRTVTFNGYEYVIEVRGTGQTHIAIHKKKQPGDMMTRLTPDGSTITEIMAVDEDGAFADSALVSLIQEPQ